MHMAPRNDGSGLRVQCTWKQRAIDRNTKGMGSGSIAHGIAISPPRPPAHAAWIGNALPMGFPSPPVGIRIETPRYSRSIPLRFAIDPMILESHDHGIRTPRAWIG